MQIVRDALRAHNDGRRLGDVLTTQQIELVMMGCRITNRPHCVQTQTPDFV